VSRPYLLDVNALVGLLWDVHGLHARTHAWFGREKPIVLGCALTELSFIRVSMADRTIAASFADAGQVLEQFTTSLGPRYRYISTLPPANVLRGHGLRGHKEVSDHYLAELARANRAQLATLDEGIKHPAVMLIAR
jgi:predicted nucleic acid-binding protein